MINNKTLNISSNREIAKGTLAHQVNFINIDNNWQPVGTFTNTQLKEIYLMLKEYFKQKKENNYE